MKIEEGRDVPLTHFPAGSYKHRNFVVWQMFSMVSQKRSDKGLQTSTGQNNSPWLFLTQGQRGARDQSACFTVC